MVFKSKKEIVKDIEASFEEEEVEELDTAESEETKQKTKRQLMPIFVLITFVLAAISAFLGYFVNDQLQQMQVREEERSKRDVSVIKPLANNLKISQREMGRQAVILAEQSETQKKFMGQAEKISNDMKKNTQLLASHEQQIQKNRESLLSTNQLIEEGHSQQMQVNTELKDQVQNWLKVEIDKVMLNLAQKDQQLQLLKQSTSAASDMKQARSGKNEKTQVAKAKTPVQEQLLQNFKAPQPVVTKETLVMPNLSLLHLYEARSMTQLLVDSLSFSYSRERSIMHLKNIQARLLNVSGNQVIRRLIEQSIRDLPNEKDSDLYMHRLELSKYIKQVMQLKVINEQISFQDEAKNEAKSATSSKEQSTLDKASDKFLDEIKSLITFRHIDKKAEHLIAPEQAFVLKQSLALKLEVTRLALVEKDKEMYHTLLNEALDLLNRHFDTNSSSVKTMNQHLLNLLERPLMIQDQTIHNSLKAILIAIDQLISRYSSQEGPSAKNDLFSGVHN